MNKNTVRSESNKNGINRINISKVLEMTFMEISMVFLYASFSNIIKENTHKIEEKLAELLINAARKSDAPRWSR
jgi:hypothetical protein